MKYSELFRILQREDWIVLRKSGGHIILGHPEKEGRIIIPFHAGKEVKKGLLKAIIKQTGIKAYKR